MYLYKAPEGDKTQSFLISIFDGTGSMFSEYDIAAQAHKEVFSCLGDKKLEFQMTEQLLDGLLPFKRAGSGNITNAFQKVFSKLLDNQNLFGNNITLLFVSDGQEEFSLEQLLLQINQVKSQFQIQFFSIAVGQSFPTSISNDLRKSIHNIDQSVPSIIKQISRPCEQIKEQFQQAFEYILNNLINFQGGKVQVRELVQETILAPKTHEVSTGIVFSCDMQKVNINEEILIPTQNIKHAEEFVKKSVHEQLINNVGDKEVYENLENGMFQVLENFPKLLENENSRKIQEVCILVHELAEGHLKLNQLNENEKATIITGIFPEEVNLVQVLAKCDKVVNCEELKAQLQNNSIASDITTKQVLKKAGCYVRGRRLADQKQQQLIVEKDLEQQRLQFEQEKQLAIEKQIELQRQQQIELEQELEKQQQLKQQQELFKQQEEERLEQEWEDYQQRITQKDEVYQGSLTKIKEIIGCKASLILKFVKNKLF